MASPLPWCDNRRLDGNMSNRDESPSKDGSLPSYDQLMTTTPQRVLWLCPHRMLTHDQMKEEFLETPLHTTRMTLLRTRKMGLMYQHIPTCPAHECRRYLQNILFRCSSGALKRSLYTKVRLFQTQSDFEDFGIAVRQTFTFARLDSILRHLDVPICSHFRLNHPSIPGFHAFYSRMLSVDRLDGIRWRYFLSSYFVICYPPPSLLPTRDCERCHSEGCRTSLGFVVEEILDQGNKRFQFCLQIIRDFQPLGHHNDAIWRLHCPPSSELNTMAQNWALFVQHKHRQHLEWPKAEVFASKRLEYINRAFARLTGNSRSKPSNSKSEEVPSQKGQLMSAAVRDQRP